MTGISKLGVGVSLALILASAVAAAGNLYLRFSQTNALRARQAQIWHAVVCDIERSVVSSPVSDNVRRTPEQKRATLKFYDHLLVVDAHAAPCNLEVTGR